MYLYILPVVFMCTQHHQWTLAHTCNLLLLFYIHNIHPRPVRFHKCRFAATPAYYFGSGSMRKLCAVRAGKNIFNFCWPPHLIDLYSADILCVSLMPVSFVYIKRDDRNMLTNGVQHFAPQPHSQNSRTVDYFYCSFLCVCKKIPHTMSYFIYS